jgi:hypothetical protein
MKPMILALGAALALAFPPVGHTEDAPASTAKFASTSKAVSVEEIISNAKTKLTWKSTSAELTSAKEQLLTIPRSSQRYSEAQAVIGKLEEYLATAKKAEAHVESKWEYRSESDKMGRGVTKFASLPSENTLTFGFPYAGGSHAQLILRSSPKYGKNVAVTIEPGQFSCPSYDGCKVSVRFDDGALQSFRGSPSTDWNPKVLFLNPYDRFLSQLRKAKHVRIEAPFFQEGEQVMEFEVTGLDW